MAKAIDKAIFPGTQGGPLEHSSPPKRWRWARRCGQSLKNTSSALWQCKGAGRRHVRESLDLVSGAQTTTLMTVDLRGNFGVTGKELEARLDEVRITAN